MSGSRGFTLIELSIVLVIIGLVVGGVLAGRNLIRATELQSVISDITKFNTATFTFREKYGRLPGDMQNATSIWGVNSGGCPAQNFSGGTCNGDGSERIDGVFTGTTAYGGASPDVEIFLYWQHLSLSGMLAGAFTGQPGAGGTRQALIGANVPASKISSAGYTLLWYDNPSSSGRFVSTGSHSIEFGTQPGYFGANYETDGRVLSASEALVWDKKYDDGYPGKGKIMVIFDGTTCTTTNDPTTSAYDISTTGPQCSFLLRTGF